jgi:hypothetical protein
MMDVEVKRRWIAALRSGKYPQGQGCLRKDSGYCCMGVLCDLYDSNLWRSQKSFYSFQGERWYLSPYILFWSGLTANNPDVMVACQECDSAQPFECECVGGMTKATLSKLNDEYRWSFDRIADIIEEQL